MWQNSKTSNCDNLKSQIVTKLKKSNCDQTQKHKLWQKPKSDSGESSDSSDSCDSSDSNDGSEKTNFDTLF